MARLWPVVLLVVVFVTFQPRLLRVVGDSMLPSLRPGHLLLTIRPFPHLIRDGCVVTLNDPRDPSRRLVKRVAARLDDLIDLRGDNPDASTDSRAFGLQRLDLLTGRVVWPPVHRQRMP